MDPASKLPKVSFDSYLKWFLDLSPQLSKREPFSWVEIRAWQQGNPGVLECDLRVLVRMSSAYLDGMSNSEAGRPAKWRPKTVIEQFDEL